MEGYGYYIRAIAFGMRYTNDQSLTDYGITNQQARLLGDIYDSIKNGREISRKALSESMGLSGPSVTSLLNGLEKSGFIIRQQGDEDGRTMKIEITAKSMQLIDETENIFAETERKLLQGFTNEQKIAFLELLVKAYKNIGTSNRA
ncbi:MAG: transcriptional regulator, MarR family [Clostridia bacterium]|jgi:DNA-binding MarR family transcriptional regulator|nr:transcriptional regulator, MarR family [Clostridia bacterium]